MGEGQGAEPLLMNQFSQWLLQAPLCVKSSQVEYQQHSTRLLLGFEGADGRLGTS